jgi:hypothetical protein
MHVVVEDVTPLRFDDGAPVRAASAVVAFAGGWLVAQDDATHAAWVRDGSVTRVRTLPPVSGLDTFEESAGTKHLKPDLEGAFVVPGHSASVALLGSGSSPARMRASLVSHGPDGPRATATDLSPLYASAARALGVAPDVLNFEGACVVGTSVRWFHRGMPSAGVPTASVDVDLAGLLAALTGQGPASAVRLGGVRRYDLGAVDGVGLAVTDAVRLRDGSILVSAAAEDTHDPRDDGPVVASVLAVLGGDGAVRSARLPDVDGAVAKVEGLAVVDDRAGPDGEAATGDDGGAGAGGSGAGGVRLLATVDADDATAASLAVTLQVRW